MYSKDELCRMEQSQLVGMIERGGLVQAVHAEWCENLGELFCNNCGGYALMNYKGRHIVKSAYCPNCGAKMESEGE